MKQKFLTFTNKISKQLSKPERKFPADITYDMLAAGSCLLTDVVDQLHENSKKINIVDRLSRHLEKGTSEKAAASYLQMVMYIKKAITFDAKESFCIISGSGFGRNVRHTVNSALSWSLR